jgi:hypothetical protein
MRYASIMIGAVIIALPIWHGLMAIAVSIVISSQPITGGYEEQFSRVISLPDWPSLVREMKAVIEGAGE